MPKQTLTNKLRSLMGIGERTEETKKDEEQRQEATYTEEEIVEALETVLSSVEENPEENTEENRTETSENTEESDKKEERKSGAMQSKRSSAPAPTPTRASSQVIQVERARIQGIQNLARAHGLSSEQESTFINSGISLNSAKAQVLDMVHQRSNTGPGFHVSTGKTAQEKFRAAASDALALRCGLKVEKPVAGAEELRGYTMAEMCREALRNSGQTLPANRVEMVGRALATTDLPLLLVDISRRSLMEGYEIPEETWKKWAKTGIATDFKKNTAVGYDIDVKPEFKPEGGEYKYGKMSERKEEYQIRTYGKKLPITREAIINDDLGALSDMPRMFGEQTAELVGDVAYDALLKNPFMGDGKTLFCTDHKNLYAGKGGVPTVENLGVIVKGMKLQKNSLGKAITVKPQFFLSPVAMETECEQFFTTSFGGTAIIGTQAKPLVINPYGGNYFTRCYDRRLDDVSPTDYYLLGSRGTVTVFFLGGTEAPWIETETNFNSDAIEMKVRMDVAAKFMTYQNGAKATKS